MSLTGAVNGTNGVIIKIDGTESTIVGQMEFTTTFTGQPIDVSNKSSNDWVCLMDRELSGKGETAAGTILYNSDATYRDVRADTVVGTIGQYKVDFGDGVNNLYFDAIPNALSDGIPMGDKVASSITFTSTSPIYGPSLPTLGLNFGEGEYYLFGSVEIDDLLTTSSRGSIATYYDDSKVLKTAQVGELRISVDPNSGYKGYLSEDQSTNLLLWSNDYTQSPWSKKDSTASTDGTKGPDGTEDMNLITDTSTTGGYVGQTMVIPMDDSYYSFSVFLKRGNQPKAGVRFAMTGGDSVFSITTYDFDEKTITIQRSSDTVSAYVEEVASGIVRLCITAQNNSTNDTLSMRIGPSDLNSSSIGDDVYATYAQVENIELCSSPIKTEGSQETRLRDNFSIDAGDWLNENQGSLFVEFLNSLSNGRERYFASLTDDTSSERFSIYSESETGIVGRNIENGNSTFVSIGTSQVLSVTKAVLGYDQTSMKGSAMGEPVNSTAVSNPSAKTVLNLGGRNTGSGAAFTLISKIYYVPVYLADDEMEGITL